MFRNLRKYPPLHKFVAKEFFCRLTINGIKSAYVIGLQMQDIGELIFEDLLSWNHSVKIISFNKCGDTV